MITISPLASGFFVGKHPIVPSFTVTEVDVILNPGVTEEVVLDSALILYSEDGTVETNGQIHFELSHGTTFTSLDTEVATVDESGYVQRVSDGVARIMAATGPNRQRLSIEVSSTDPTLTRTWVEWLPGTLEKYALDRVIELVDGLTASATTRNAFIEGARNPDIFCAAYVDCLTAVAKQNNTGWVEGIGFTAITPRHVVGCEHAAFGNGTILDWMTADDDLIQRAIVASVPSPDGADLRVYLLDSDLPASIQPIKLLPANVTDYMPNQQYRMPTGQIFIDRTNTLSIGRTLDVGGVWRIDGHEDFYTYPIVGTSGKPVFLPYSDTEMAMVFLFSGPTGGATMHDRNWASIIPALDAAGGVSTGYLPERADLSAFIDYSTVIHGTPGLVGDYDPDKSSTLYDATSGGAAPADGDAVRRMESRTGTFPPLLEYGAAPILRAGAINGRAALELGTASRMMASTTPVPAMTATTLFFVGKTDDTFPDSNEIVSFGGGGRFMIGVQNQSAKMGRSGVAWDAYTDQRVLNDRVFIIAARASASGMKFRVNNGEDFERENVPLLDGVLELVAATGVRILAARLLFYNRELTDGEVTEISDDLFDTYHPFLLRVQTHLGDGAPYRLWSDAAKTVPIEEDGTLTAWDWPVGSEVAQGTGSRKPTVPFIDGIPVVALDGVNDNLVTGIEASSIDSEGAYVVTFFAEETAPYGTLIGGPYNSPTLCRSANENNYGLGRVGTLGPPNPQAVTPNAWNTIAISWSGTSIRMVVINASGASESTATIAAPYESSPGVLKMGIHWTDYPDTDPAYSYSKHKAVDYMIEDKYLPFVDLQYLAQRSHALRPQP